MAGERDCEFAWQCAVSRLSRVDLDHPRVLCLGTVPRRCGACGPDARDRDTPHVESNESNRNLVNRNLLTMVYNLA